MYSNRLSTLLIPACVTFALAAPLWGQLPLQGKQVAAPASDIRSGLVQLPDREAFADSIRGNLLEWHVQEGHPQATLWVPAGPVRIVPLWIEQPTERWQFRMGRGPWQTWAELEDLGLATLESMERTDPWTSMAPNRLTLDLRKGGLLAMRDTRPAAHAGDPLFTMVEDASASVMHHGLGSYRTVAGEPIPLLAWLSEDGAPSTVLRAEVRLSNGSEERTLTLCDDGQHGDGEAQDGQFGAWVPSDWLGATSAWTTVQGIDATGQRFGRQGRSFFEVVPPMVQLKGDASVSLARQPVDPNSVDRRGDLLGVLQIALPTYFTTDRASLHVAAEIWGTAADGTSQPMCWLARQCNVPAQPGLGSIDFELDLSWLVLEGLRPPLELRNVRVQDPASWDVWEERSVVALPAFSLEPVDPSILMGPPVNLSAKQLAFRPAGVVESAVAGGMHLMQPSGTAASARSAVDAWPSNQRLEGLLLVHGWCSSVSTFPPAQFDGPKRVFSDPNQNRTFDEFAQLLAQDWPSRFSFGIVAHSQGGNAALHMLTYYSTPLDNAVGPRKIQSLASPYQGTPLASLGFFLCGTNNDMTPSGAAAWLANIPTVSREEVYYYTTSTRGFFGCQFATNPLLTNPEDGVVEQFRGQLPGAHNMGHTTGWCHTTGMNDPAGYDDASRNAIMNAQAAR